MFVIFGIVSSISKTRTEARKKQDQQNQQRMRDAYPPGPALRRSPPQTPYEPENAPQQVNYEPPRPIMPFGVPPAPYHVAPPPEQFEPVQAQYEPPPEQFEAQPAPSETLFDQLFSIAEGAMAKLGVETGARDKAAEGPGDMAHPAVSLQQAPAHRLEAAPTVTDKLMRKAPGEAVAEQAPPNVRRAGGFALGASRRDIINGVIWSEILARPGERPRRRAF